MSENSSSTISGIPTKYVCLLILVVQNSVLVLTLRYSRVQPGPRYLSSTAVLVSEVLKCIICLAVHLYQQYNKRRDISMGTLLGEEEPVSPWSITQLGSDIFSTKSGFFKILIPAVLYTFQNNLQFVAASNLDAAIFQVTYQFKILTTALFAVMLLGQSLSWLKWLSLLILTVGVGCVQIPTSTSSTSQTEGDYFIGIVAVAVACLCSGIASVYFEKVLKTNDTTSIWIRNIQLSVGCLAIAAGGTLMWDGPAIMEDGFFQGYNAITVLVILIQASYGLIVALVIKYADNILKGFGTSLSVILSTIASVFLFNFVITPFFIIGSAFVFLATFLYSKPDSSDPTVQPVEQNPMIDREEYDEKLQAENEGDSEFRDSDVETIGEKTRESNQAKATDAEGKIYEELGYVF